MQGYITTPWGQIHYRRAGDRGPSLALLHATPLSSRMFDRTLPLLGQAVRAFAFDTPGYGQSDPPDAPLEIPQYASRLRTAIDGLGLDRVALVGVHTGAAIALEIALQIGSDRVTHLVLSGIPLLSEEERRAFLALIAEPALDLDGSHLQRVWHSRMRAYGEDPPVELLQMATVEMLKVYPRYHWAIAPAFRYDPAPGLARLTCPVLLLNAEHDMLVHGDRAARALLRFPTLSLVAGMAGPLAWRAPDIYATEILEFLSRGSDVG